MVWQMAGRQQRLRGAQLQGSLPAGEEADGWQQQLVHLERSISVCVSLVLMALPMKTCACLQTYKMPPVTKKEGCAAWACDQFKGMYVYRTRWVLPSGFKCSHCKMQVGTAEVVGQGVHLRGPESYVCGCHCASQGRHMPPRLER